MTAVARLLPCGTRLHLQHGPIDLILGADAPHRRAAFAAAEARFATVLGDLVAELPLLRRELRPDAPRPEGAIARRMDAATRPHLRLRLTPMAAVAGAVADTILDAMRAAAPLPRAYVNNGGDIALHLAPGQRYTSAIRLPDGTGIGRIALAGGDGIGGIATSGRHGRSLSLGIADSVTVLAQTAAEADAAATLIANAVDLPGHPAIRRCPARALDPDSDLGDRAVVTGLGPLDPGAVAKALAAGLARAEAMRAAGRIAAAALHLRGETRIAGPHVAAENRSLAHA